MRKTILNDMYHAGSVSQIHGLIAEEEKSVPSDKIFVGGFSQGGAIALYSGLTYKNKLAGILCLLFIVVSFIPNHTNISLFPSFSLAFSRD